jgi:WD40 repeat protein
MALLVSFLSYAVRQLASVRFPRSVPSFIGSSGCSLRRHGLIGTMGIIMAGAAMANEQGTDNLRLRQEWELPTSGVAVAVAWSSDGTLAAASDYGTTITVWDKAGHVVRRIKRAGAGPVLDRSLTFVDSSSKLAFAPPAGSSNSAAIAVWDVASGNLANTLAGPQPGDDYFFNRAAFYTASPDGTLLVAATAANAGTANLRNNIVAYETQDWRLLYKRAEYPAISAICMLGRGRLVAIAAATNQATVRILNALSGENVTEFDAYPDVKKNSIQLGSLAGSPAGDLILTGVYSNYDDSNGKGAGIDAVRIFKVQGGAKVAGFSDAREPIRRAVWDPKGRYVAFVDNAGRLYLWSTAFNADVQTIRLAPPTFSLAVAPNGERLAVTAGRGVIV